MNIFRRLLLNHHHILRLEDMAIGISDGKPGVPVTGWRWKCVICGKIIEEYTESGMELITLGHPKEVVFQWLADKTEGALAMTDNSKQAQDELDAITALFAARNAEIERQAAEIERLNAALEKILITSGRQTIYKIARAARSNKKESD